MNEFTFYEGPHNLGAHDAEHLGGFFKKITKAVSKVVKPVAKVISKPVAVISKVATPVLKPVGRVAKKVSTAVVPKQVRRFGSRAWKNPYVKVAGTVALGAVGTALLGPVVGGAVAKVGGVAADAVGLTAGQAATIGNAVNTASRVYNTAENVAGGIKVTRAVRRARRGAAAPLPAKLPDYSPAPSAIDSPAAYDLARAEALKTLQPQLDKMNSDERAKTITALEEHIKSLQTQAAAIVPPSYQPQPIAAARLDQNTEVATQADAKEQATPNYLIPAGIAAALFLLS